MSRLANTVISFRVRQRVAISIGCWLVGSLLVSLCAAEEKGQRFSVGDLCEQQLRQMVFVGMEEAKVREVFGRPRFELIRSDGVLLLEYRLGDQKDLVRKKTELWGFDIEIKEGRVSTLRPILTRANSHVCGSNGLPWLDFPPPESLTGASNVKRCIESVKLVRKEVKMTLAEKRSFITKIVFQMDALLDAGEDVQIAKDTDVFKLLTENFRELRPTIDCKTNTGAAIGGISLRKLAEFFRKSEAPSVKELSSPGR